MKVAKIVAGAIFVVIALAVIVVIYVLANINNLVKDAVEEVGPQITSTPVHLDSVDIDIRQGRGQLDGFVVENPPDYLSDNLFSFDSAVLQIEPGSIAQPVKVINEVTVEGVQIVAEQKGLTTNLQQILKNIKAAAGPAAEEPTASRADVRLMIEQLNFTGGSIKLITEEYGEYDVPLPPVALENIGDKVTGLTPKELGMAIVTPLLQQAQDAVQDRIESEARQRVEEEVKGKLREKAEEKLGEGAEEKIEELKGLLGR